MVEISGDCCAVLKLAASVGAIKMILRYPTRSRQRSVMVRFFHAHLGSCRLAALPPNRPPIQSEHPDNIPGARSLSQHTQFSAKLQPERERHAQRQEMHAPAGEEEQIRSEPC